MIFDCGKIFLKNDDPHLCNNNFHDNLMNCILKIETLKKFKIIELVFKLCFPLKFS